MVIPFSIRSAAACQFRVVGSPWDPAGNLEDWGARRLEVIDREGHRAGGQIAAGGPSKSSDPDDRLDPTAQRCPARWHKA